jgi:hypothetical protein
MKSHKAKLPPGFRFDREEANERSEPGQQSAQANAEAIAEPGGGLALAQRIHQRFKGFGLDKLPIPERQSARPLPDLLTIEESSRCDQINSRG